MQSIYANSKKNAQWANPLQNGGQVMVYSNADQLFLQLNHETPTESNILEPSFKIALVLTHEVLLLASERLQVATNQISTLNP